jgi:hypothetical protein
VADRTSDGRPIRMLTAGSLGVSSPPIAYVRMVLWATEHRRSSRGR